MSVKLDELQYLPNDNPYATSTAATTTIQKKRDRYTVSAKRELMDTRTGEIEAVASIHMIRNTDNETFVKLFEEGIKRWYGLTHTASRVFMVILEKYQETPMQNGYAESVYLAWYSGQTHGMSRTTFNYGIRELIEKEFIKPKMPNMFWINPALFFKGDRAKFVMEYRRKAVQPHYSGWAAEAADAELATITEITRNEP